MEITVGSDKSYPHVSFKIKIKIFRQAKIQKEGRNRWKIKILYLSKNTF